MTDAPPTQPGRDITESIEILNQHEWFNICAFFDAARLANPYTEERMRKQLGMTEDETMRDEIKDTVSHFDSLREVGQTFEDEVKWNTRSLADEIFQYSKLAESTYEVFERTVDRFSYYDTEEFSDIGEKLDKILELSSIGDDAADEAKMAKKIKGRISMILNRLSEEAEARQASAKALTDQITKSDTGLIDRIKKCRDAFEEDRTAIEGEFGQENERLKSLRSKLSDLQHQLKVARQKEYDEEMVLKTSPVYLVIPFLGPFVLAAVDAGVGADLAINTKPEIARLVNQIATLRKKISASEAFVGYYQGTTEMLGGVLNDVADVNNKLEKLGNGWRTIAADIKNITSLLDQGAHQAVGEDFINLTTSLIAGEKMWHQVGLRADQIRSVCIPEQIDSPDEFAA